MVITLHRYRHDLPQIFEKEKKRIIGAIPFIKDIHHVGSSAVFGLSGKNVVDILIGLDQYKNLEVLTKEFEKLGYLTKFVDYQNEWTF